MQRIIIIILLLTLSFKGFSTELDTLDYWHVYKNDKIIAKFNSVSKDLNIKINKSEIKESDTISIRYGKDTRCSNCKYILFVRDEKKRKLRITESDKYWDKLSFGFLDLIEFGQKNKSKRYDFYYWERNSDGKNQPMKLVLKMTLE
ncbi:hypothetical protein DIS07_14755 [Polaribacter aquimarinus]|uniref:Uncharacterized protein n=1 Tax=Polaribacter aquimarinus TaxID=2100726 RepID=A0A2U2J6T3_9FLAO|nr:hypothetical protein DIS07_14755 [Polaribacter aquimarinus]